MNSFKIVWDVIIEWMPSSIKSLPKMALSLKPFRQICNDLFSTSHKILMFTLCRVPEKKDPWFSTLNSWHDRNKIKLIQFRTCRFLVFKLYEIRVSLGWLFSSFSTFFSSLGLVCINGGKKYLFSLYLYDRKRL